MHRIRYGAALAIMILLLAPAAPSEAQADPGAIQVFGIRQQNLDNSGGIDLTIIDCAIVTPNDRVLVFDGGSNMRPSTNWQEATDFVDDTWIFNIGGGSDSSAALIITFATDGSDTIARIYDGSVTGGAVQYEIAGISPYIVAPVVPTLIIRANGPWLQSDGGLNYNMTWQFDGPAANREQAQRLPSMFIQDGNADSEGEVEDQQHDGIPDYLWTTLLTDIPLSEGFSRTGVQVNSGHYRPSALRNIVFWPLLNMPDNPQGHNYFATPLFLGVNWRTGLIESFRFGGYPIENGYHINSLSPLQAEGINELAFENPMAYYDLAGDADGRPELFIRMAYTPRGDPYFLSTGPTPTPMQMVQYSWYQRNEDFLRWDFKLDVAGVNPITTSVTFGDRSFYQVPYAELPRWVMTRPWAFATFVAFESGEGYLSSEGLYEWSTLEGVQSYGGLTSGGTLAGMQDYTDSKIQDIPRSEQWQRNYLAGVTSRSPAPLYQSILAGFRSEYADVNGRAALYFSPIDGRLHLVGATQGVYNLGDGRRVEYRNLGGGDAIDSWQLYSTTQLVAHLLQAQEFLVYSSADRVTLRQATVPRERFRTQPPTTPAEWRALGAQLDANTSAIALDDFEAMVQQFPGPTSELAHATLRDYRSLPHGGFRFVLDLQPGFSVGGVDLLQVASLPPGSYAVTYNGRFTVEPLTPPAPTAAFGRVALTQLEAGAIPVVLQNNGLQDIPQATLEVWAAQPAAPAQLVVTQTVALLARAPITATLVWAPPAAGPWTLTAQIREADGQVRGVKPAAIAVQPRLSASPGALLRESSAPQVLAVVLLLAVLIVGGAGVVVWQQRGAAHPTEVDDAANQ